jgi:hypothetical protein
LFPDTVYRAQIHAGFQDSKHKTLTAGITGIFYKVHDTFGYGFFELSHENAMLHGF